MSSSSAPTLKCNNNNQCVHTTCDDTLLKNPLVAPEALSAKPPSDKKNPKNINEGNDHKIRSTHKSHLLECAKAALHTKSIFIEDITELEKVERKRKRKKKPTVIIATNCIIPQPTSPSSLADIDFSSSSKSLFIKVKPLLILDLNGVLCHRVRNSHQNSNTSSPPKLYRQSIGHVALTPIIPRIDVHDFLYFLDTHFTLAVWTSAKKGTANFLVNLLIPSQIKDRLLFVWGQEKCKKTPNPSISTANRGEVGKSKLQSSNESSVDYNYQHKVLLIKSLGKVWAEWPLWNSHNTLLIDDSPHKCPPSYRQNYLHPPSINGLITQPPEKSSVGKHQEEDNNHNPFNESQLNKNVEAKEDQIDGGDVWNAKQQFIFFEKLVNYLKMNDHQENNCVSKTKNLLYIFLKEYGRGHMGWRSVVNMEKI